MISWIKLDINILDDAKIKIIRSHPNGDSVVLLWIGLLCLAMKSSRPGTIEIADGLPYTLDDLANQFNIEKKTVEMGIALFVKYRMIEVFQGGAIDVINFSKHQNLDKIEFVREQNRARQRRHRKSKLLAITSGNCVYCGSKDNLETDHIIPISHGGKGTDDNLVSACRDCNTSKNNHNILHFLNYILVDKADHKSINKNQNLMRIIRYDFDLSRYVTRDSVTVTQTDIDKDKDVDKDKDTTCEAQEIIISIPLSNKNEFPVTKAMVSEWESLYPNVDIGQELRNIRGWNISNEKKRKTSRGIMAHINTWLHKAQNRGGNGNGSGNSAGSRTAHKKTGDAQSDGQPYPADREY